MLRWRDMLMFLHCLQSNSDFKKWSQPANTCLLRSQILRLPWYVTLEPMHATFCCRSLQSGVGVLGPVPVHNKFWAECCISEFVTCKSSPAGWFGITACSIATSRPADHGTDFSIGRWCARPSRWCPWPPVSYSWYWTRPRARLHES
jgi:hypothetical protein